MQVVLNADKASFVQSALIKGGTQDLSYSTEDSFPIVSKANRSFMPITPFSGMPDGNTHTFVLPPGGWHYLGLVKYECTKSFALNEAPGFSITNAIRLCKTESGGHPIMNLSGQAIEALIMNLPGPLQEFCRRYTRALDPITEEPLDGTARANANFVTYLPLFASWYEDVVKALNSSQLDKLQISFTYKSAAESGFGINPLTKLSPKLENFTYMPDAETYNKMLVKDYSGSILMPCFNTYTEQLQLTALDPATTTRIEYQVQSNVAAYKTHIFVQKANSTANTGFYRHNLPMVPIHSLSVSFGGEPYIQNYTRAMCNYEQAVRGFSNHTVAPVVVEGAAGAGGSLVRTSAIGYNENQCFTIDWSLLCGRDSNSGLIAMSGLGKPLLEINIAPYILTAAGGAASAELATSYNLYVVHEYWNILKTDPASKTISIAAAT